MTELKDTPKPEDKPIEPEVSSADPFKDVQDTPAPATSPPPVTNATKETATTTTADAPGSADDNAIPPPPRTSSSPIPAHAPEAVATPPSTTPAVTHPGVAALRSMFPDFDDLLLLSVLDSVNGDQDRAIDVLLGMNDPEYKSTAPAEPVLSQAELDEQFARRLHFEDQQQAQAAWMSQQQHAPHPGFQNRPDYRPGGGRAPASPNPNGEKDTMAEIGEQFNKFAETGKKTLGTLFSKVKAKVQEFDQNRQQGQSSNYQQQQQPWGVGGDTYSYTPPLQQQQAAYYDPNPQPGPTSPQSVQGYNATPSPAATARTEQPAAQPAVTPTPAPAPIGLLPKRPVSLLRTQSPEAATGSAPATTAVTNAAAPAPAIPAKKPTQDDELEYAENPFEEAKK